MKDSIEIVKNICSNCKNWKKEQAELDYSTFYGICTCANWKFTTNGNADICILDRNNKSEKHMHVSRFENQSDVIPFGQANVSRYCFITNENFGCIHFKKRK